MAWLRASLAAVVVSVLGLSVSVAQECEPGKTAPFTAQSSTHASVVRDTRHGKIQVTAARTGQHSVRFGFRVNGRPMTTVSLKDAPESVRACSMEQIRAAGGVRAKRRFYCFILGDDAKCDDHSCTATACCLVGSVHVCANGTASF